MQEHGQLDTLLYNAGGGETTFFSRRGDLSSAHYELQLNYMGLLSCLRYALPYLLNAKGRIVGISSIGGLIELPRHLPTTALNSLCVAF